MSDSYSFFTHAHICSLLAFIQCLGTLYPPVKKSDFKSCLVYMDRAESHAAKIPLQTLIIGVPVHIFARTCIDSE